MNTIFWLDDSLPTLQMIVFDAVTSLNPEDTVTITDHPVEEGSDVTDNARSNAGRLSMEAIVSMTPNPKIDPDVQLADISFTPDVRNPMNTVRFPLDIPSPPIQLSASGLLHAGAGALVGLFSGAPTAQGLETSSLLERKVITARGYQQTSPRNRIRDVYEALLQLKDKHLLVNVTSSHRDYFDLMIERVGKPQSAVDGELAKFQIDFKQIRTVSSASVAAPKPAETRGETIVNKGAQGAKPAKDQPRSVSVAKQIKNYSIHLFTAP